MPLAFAVLSLVCGSRGPLGHFPPVMGKADKLPFRPPVHCENLSEPRSICFLLSDAQLLQMPYETLSLYVNLPIIGMHKIHKTASSLTIYKKYLIDRLPNAE